MNILPKVKFGFCANVSPLALEADLQPGGWGRSETKAIGLLIEYPASNCWNSFSNFENCFLISTMFSELTGVDVNGFSKPDNLYNGRIDLVFNLQLEFRIGYSEVTLTTARRSC